MKEMQVSRGFSDPASLQAEAVGWEKEGEGAIHRELFPLSQGLDWPKIPTSLSTLSLPHKNDQKKEQSRLEMAPYPFPHNLLCLLCSCLWEGME